MITLAQVFFIIVIVFASLYVVRVQRMMHAVFAFLIMLLGLAGLYVIQNAELVAAAHIFVYIGGILVVILFGVMLAGEWIEQEPVKAPVSVGIGLLSAVLLLGLWYVFGMVRFEEIQLRNSLQFIGTVQQTQPQIPYIALQIFTTYAFPFEIAGTVLLIALIGAVFIAKQTKALPKNNA